MGLGKSVEKPTDFYYKSFYLIFFLWVYILTSTKKTSKTSNTNIPFQNEPFKYLSDVLEQSVTRKIKFLSYAKNQEKRTVQV